MGSYDGIETYQSVNMTHTNNIYVGQNVYIQILLILCPLFSFALYWLGTDR